MINNRYIKEFFIQPALISLILIVVIKNAWVCDDSYITFRVIDNFVNGFGLRWNVIDRVQAYSNPLWLLLMTPVYLFTGEFYLSSIAVSVILSAGAVFLAIKNLGRNPLFIVSGSVFLICSNSFIDYSTSGLENALSHLLLMIFLVIYNRGNNGSRNLFFLFLTGGFIVFNRIDHGIVILPFMIDCLFKYNRSLNGKNLSFKSIITALSGMAPFILWILFSIFYYGFPFPNTAYAKLNIGIERYLIIKQGIYYIGDFIWHDFIGASAVGILLLSSFPLIRNLKKLPYFTGTVLYISYIIWIGGDFMSGRFFTVLIILSFSEIISFNHRQAFIVNAVLIPAVLLFSFLNPRSSILSDSNYSNKAFFHQIADERGYYFAYTGLFNNSKLSEKPLNPFENKGLRDGKFIIKDGVGFSGFNFGHEYHILDRYALGEPLLSRIPYQNSFEIKKEFRPGHNGRDFPAGLKETIKTGENKIVHPSLKIYFDKIAVLTRENIFSWNRFKEIIKMNTGSYDHLVEEYFSVKLFSAYEMETNYSKGSLIRDSESESGFVRFSGNEKNAKGFLVFGPYIKMKKGLYRADFNIRCTECGISGNIAKIDVFSRNRSIASKVLKYNDFENSIKYRKFQVFFELEKDTEKIEFRVKITGNSKISADTIMVSRTNQLKMKDTSVVFPDKKISLMSFEFERKDYQNGGILFSGHPGIKCEWDGQYDKEQYLFDWISPDGNVAYSLHLRESVRSGKVWYPYKGPYPLKNGKWTVRARKIPYLTSLNDIDAGEKSFIQ